MIRAGESLSRYRLVEKIGEGGHGDVWKAIDTRLDREIAVKILPREFAQEPERLTRFECEAKAVAALNHPNIVTIHSVEESDGVHFITMELVRGRTLAALIPTEGMSPRQFFKIAIPLTDAVAAAHDQGLTHRDLKPANVMVNDKGTVKVLDFGLADFRESDAAAERGERATRNLTQEKAIRGTLPYMSPEQIKGRPLDNRTDIFSLGAMLYEMATGRRPFEASTAADLIAVILRDEPRPVGDFNRELSAGTARLISQCLQKDRDTRIDSAHELMARLEALRLEFTTDATSAARRGIDGAEPKLTSLAVLPLANLSGDPAQEFFTDGMTDALITDLAKIKGLKVISRTSAMRYKGVSKPLREIAAELGVSTIVEGSVLRAGNRVRISAQLVDAGRDEHLWAESYDREIRDVLTLQGEVARAIAAQVHVKLTRSDSERLGGGRAVNPEAHEAYLRGRHFWHKRTAQSVRKGLEYFEEAARLDPGYAPAWAGVADSYLVDGGRYLGVPAADAYARAFEAAQKALEIDGDLAEAHCSLAGVQSDHDWKWDEASRSYERAIELNPNYVTARYWYADHLSRLCRHDDAAREARFAREIDPLSVISNMMVAWVLYFARRYDEAIDQVGRTLELDPEYAAAWRVLGWAHAERGELEQAVEAHEKAASITAGSPNYRGPLGLTYARAGRAAEAREILRELSGGEDGQATASFDCALIHAWLGDKESALQWLERACDQHHDQVAYLAVNPRLDPLRDDPRFAALLQRVGLPG